MEVILKFKFIFALQVSILHVCGGDPLNKLKDIAFDGYSPRVWRWSYKVVQGDIIIRVFSTCVEVIPNLLNIEFGLKRILHVCGGDP